MLASIAVNLKNIYEVYASQKYCRLIEITQIIKMKQPTCDKSITFLKIELFDILMHFMQMLIFCFACFKMRSVLLY